MDLPSPHAPGDDARTGTTAPLNAAERVWIAQHRELVAELCDGAVDEWSVSHLFDRVHGTWLAAAERPDPEPLVHAFGVALGDLTVRLVPALTWVSYAEHAGTQLAIAADDEPLVFPLASVDKHWPTAAPGWFASHVHAVVEQSVRQLGASAGRRGPHAESPS